MGFPFSVTGVISWSRAPNDMRTVEDVCAQIEEMLKAIKSKTMTRRGETISYTPGLFPTGTNWNLPKGIDRGEFTVEDAGIEWRVRYFGSMIRQTIFITLLVLIFIAVLFYNAPQRSEGWPAHPIAVPVLSWLWICGGNYAYTAVCFVRWLKRGVQPTK
jgi:hypothetical protein